MLGAMAGELAASGQPSDFPAERDLALHLAPGSRAAALYRADDLAIAVDGHPRWSDPDVASVAAAQGQAAAIAHAYRAHGQSFLSLLHGSFVVAILDRKARRCLLAIDRMGVHGLCYGQPKEGGIIFGTNAASVAAHPCLERKISPQGLYNYLLFFYVPAPGTIYEFQRKLLPAQYLLYENGKVSCDFYWQVPYKADKRASFADLKSQLFDSLESSVDHALEGESLEDTGAFLSGGLDSSAVVGVFSQSGERRVKAFTIGFDSETHDETAYAQVAAGHFNCEHHAYRVTPEDVRDFIPRIGAAFDEPFGNASVVPTYYCARLARQHGVDLLLAGDGGDELFAGNAWYPRQKLFELYQHVPRALRRGLIEPLAFGLPGGERLPLVRKARKYITQANRPMPDRGFRPETGAGGDISEILAPDLFEQVDLEAPLEVLREGYFRPQSTDLIHRMQHLDLETVLAGCDIRKVNRMCALAGVRVRYPLLDESVVEMSARVPPALLLRNFKLRYFYRRSMAGFLPKAVLTKEKHGFGLPWAPWLSEQPKLRELVYDSLNMAKRRGLVRRDYVDRLIEQQKNNPGAPAFAGPVWDLMILELWFQSHMDSRPRNLSGAA